MAQEWLYSIITHMYFKILTLSYFECFTTKKQMFEMTDMLIILIWWLYNVYKSQNITLYLITLYTYYVSIINKTKLIMRTVLSNPTIKLNIETGERWPSISTPSYVMIRTRNIHQHKNLNRNNPTSVTHDDSSKAEAAGTVRELTDGK